MYIKTYIYIIYNIITGVFIFPKSALGSSSD